MIIFESARLYARRYTLDDMEMFHALNANGELMQYIRPVMTFEQSRKFLDENIRFYETHPTMGRWALLHKLDHHILGSVSLLPLANSNDLHVGYVLFKAYWGFGFAAEIVKAGIDYAFDALKRNTLTAITYAENFSSQKVLLKNGFSFERSFFENGKENRLYRLNAPANYLNPVS